MFITQHILNDLTLNTLYTVKFAVLQRTPSYIKVTANNGTSATVQYYDSTGVTLQQTLTQSVNQSVWTIDLTK